MKKLLTFSFIGGDLRQVEVLKELSEDGFLVKSFGVGKEISAENIKQYKKVKDCIKDTDVIVLPLPLAIDKRINAPFCDEEIYIEDIINNAREKTIVFGGKIDEETQKKCEDRGLLVIDYAKREEMAVMNAVPTAEGAISIAIENTPYTLFDSNCLVVGYGRIGKILAADLKALGANVTASARKYSDLAWIKANGLKAIKTLDLDKYADSFDIIFNTVCHTVIDVNVLLKTKKDVLIIDLASLPGGVDFPAAKKLNRRVIQALSLPGRIAPKTAGKIIKSTLVNILEELEV